MTPSPEAGKFVHWALAHPNAYAHEVPRSLLASIGHWPLRRGIQEAIVFLACWRYLDGRPGASLPEEDLVAWYAHVALTLAFEAARRAGLLAVQGRLPLFPHFPLAHRFRIERTGTAPALRVSIEP